MSETNNDCNKSAFQIRVMTYNIQQIYNMGPKTWWDQANRAAHIPDALIDFFANKAEDDDDDDDCTPDILILNEAFNSYAATIASRLHHVFPYQTSVIGKSTDEKEWKSTTGTFRTSFSVINGGVMILSRHKIVEQRQHIYHATHSNTWDSWANKGIAYVKIKLNEKPNQAVHILGTHLQADEGHVPPSETHKVRMEQLKELRYFVAEELKLSKDEIVLIGGDLNVEYTTKSFRNGMESTLNVKVGEMLCQASSSPLGQCGSFSALHNWMTKANARANGQSEERNETLDYILIPKDFVKPVTDGQSTKVEVIRLQSKKPLYWSYLAQQWPNEKGFHHDLSDHYPVYGHFTFPCTAGE